ncbi:MAG: integrase [Burkholderiales bacterium]|jgi:site-specific recombinase XerD|nr:integrase [Burkholderiales bacterium]
MSDNIVIHNIANALDAPLKEYSSIKATNDIEAIQVWLTEFQNSPHTFTSYRQAAERFLMWCMQNKLKLAELSREDILGYQSFLQSPTPGDFWCGPSKPRHDPNWRPFVKGLANSSIRLNLQILTTMYEYMVQSGYLNLNPFKLIKRKSARLTVNKGVERYLTHKELDYILDYINNMPKKTQSQIRTFHRIKWVFSLLYLSGCRRQEIVNAKMSDFVRKQGNWWLKVIGKGNKYGEVPVTNDLLLALIEYRKSIGLPDYPIFSETDIALVNNLQVSPGKYVGITDSMLYKMIKTTCSEIANHVKISDPGAAFVIEQVSTHWLRHTSATHQVDAGIDIRVVKENLRHSLLETTMKYQHTESDARHQETSKKFGIK